MRDLPRFFDEEIAEMRKGLKRGFTPPQITCRGVRGRSATSPPHRNKNAFFKPFETMPTTMPATDQARTSRRRKAAIEQAVIPAYSKLLKFWTKEYVPGTRTTLAARAICRMVTPSTAPMFREYVTLDTSPEENPSNRRVEVARINAAMEKVKSEAGFIGSMADFLKF